MFSGTLLKFVATLTFALSITLLTIPQTYAMGSEGFIPRHWNNRVYVLQEGKILGHQHNDSDNENGNGGRTLKWICPELLLIKANKTQVDFLDSQTLDLALPSMQLINQGTQTPRYSVPENFIFDEFKAWTQGLRDHMIYKEDIILSSNTTTVFDYRVHNNKADLRFSLSFQDSRWSPIIRSSCTYSPQN